MFALLLLVFVGQCAIVKCKGPAWEDRKLDRIEKVEQELQSMDVILPLATENQPWKDVPDHDEASIELSKRSSSDSCPESSAVYDCSDIKANGQTCNGVYRIHVDHENIRHYANAYCDMTTGQGGWTIFQRRKDGSEDFYRGWNDYANGFGNPNGEYWLGNEFVHLLTSTRRYRLRIDLEDFEGNTTYAEYSTFSISSSADKYRLRIGTYSGTAGDSLGSPEKPSHNHNGRQFSTKDVDNDAWSDGNCAVDFRGAWWYNSCFGSNLNGIYKRRGSHTDRSSFGIDWYNFRGYYYSLKTTEMKISPVT